MQRSKWYRAAGIATFALALSVPVRAQAPEPPPPPQFSAVVLIDPSALNDAQRAALLTIMGRLPNALPTRTINVANGDTLFGIVNREYRYFDSLYPQTTSAIAQLIQDANKDAIPQPEMLKAGTTIVAPVLPERPYDRGTKAGFVQKLMSANQTAFASVNTLSDVTLPEVEQPQSAAPLGATWLLTMSREALSVFRASLPADAALRRALYIGPTDEHMAELDNLEAMPTPSADPAGTVITSDDYVRKIILSLKPESLGLYHVIDRFDSQPADPCLHGQFVYGVVRQTLQSAGAPDSFLSRVRKVELDYFSHRAAARPFIERYAKSFSPENEKQILAWLKSLESRKVSAGAQLSVPMLYIQALNFDLISTADTGVVSSSFSTMADGFEWLPGEYRETSDIPLISAVLNDQNSLIESDIYIKRQPQRTFYDRRDRYGVILVGAESAPGTLHGMRSKAGDGVTVIGHGAGWSAPAGCKPQIGTSLATPEIGAKLFLARGYWKQNKVTVSAREAKVRLLLASDVQDAYVGSYASAGVPALHKLLRISPAFVEYPSGEVRDLAAVPIGYIDIAQTGGAARLRFGCEQGQLRGLAVRGNNVYILHETQPVWRKVTVLDVHLTVGADPSITTVQKLLESIKGVGIL